MLDVEVRCNEAETQETKMSSTQMNFSEMTLKMNINSSALQKQYSVIV